MTGTQLPAAAFSREKKLRLALAAQLLFFAGWGAWLLSSRAAASPEFYLETAPVDPRDLISGTYVDLTYAISSPEPCRALMGANEAGTLYVKLEDRGKKALTPAGPVSLYEAADCAEYPGEGTWARLRADNNLLGSFRAAYGIERFYLNEHDPRKDARSGSVVAKVKLGHGNSLVLLDLVQKI